MVIRLSHHHSFRIKLGIGVGTNTKVELLALLDLLFFVREKDISSITIFGDSKVVMDWEKDVHSLHSIELHHWINRVKNLINSFQQISFNHIYREMNMDAELLSKQALGEGMEAIVWELVQDGLRIEHG